MDQLGFSELFKLRAGTRRASAPSQVFWERADQAVKRAVLLQQVVLPTSNVHTDETAVFKDSLDLRIACELIGGDVSFKRTPQVEIEQFFKFANSFIEARSVPQVEFEVDDVIEDDRNAWLPDLHITTNMDLSAFADEIRKSRSASSDALADLVHKWKQTKPTFEDQLAVELKGWGITLIKTYANLNDQVWKAQMAGDAEGMVAASSHRVSMLVHLLMDKFKVSRLDVDPDDRQRFIEFMRWEGLEQLPTHRISAYLFAALARRYRNGQVKLPTQGMLNDFTAIATYAPYVDAMFLDRECAALLSEEPLRSDLPIRGKVFSTATGDEFISYLDELSDGAPSDVRAYSHELYGIE